MSNWVYSIGFGLGNTSAISRAESMVRGLDDAVDDVGDSAGRTGGNLNKMGNTGASSFSRLRQSALSFIGVATIMATTLGSIKAAADFDAQNIAIDFATSGDGAKNIEFINKISDELGTNLQANREGFKQLAGSLRGTAMEGQGTRDLFEGINAAGGAMRLSADQIKGAYLAVGQIASKGKVQAEELRGQLGERIPGAFKIAADAMGVTQAELNKMLDTGQVVAEDFLPKFAQQLKTTFGEDAARVAQGPAANMERFTNSVYDLQVAFGTYLLPTVNSLLSNYLIPAVKWMGEHVDVMMTLGAVIGGVWVATKAASIATEGWTLATRLLGVAMNMTPLGWLVTGIAALAAGTIYAWNKFAGFRGFLTGMWEAFKETASIVYDYMIKPFLSFGKVVLGVFTFDKNLIKEGFNDSISFAEKLLKGESVVSRIGNAFSSGFEKGVANFAKDKKDDAVSTAISGSPVVDFSGSSTGGNKNTVAGTAGRSRDGIGGATKGRNVVINLQNLVGSLEISVANATEAGDEIADLVMRKLTQALNTANAVQ